MLRTAYRDTIPKGSDAALIPRTGVQITIRTGIVNMILKARAARH